MNIQYRPHAGNFAAGLRLAVVAMIWDRASRDSLRELATAMRTTANTGDWLAHHQARRAHQQIRDELVSMLKPFLLTLPVFGYGGAILHEGETP